MQVVLAATGVVRNKVVAFRLGPTAFGELAQIAAIISVASTLATFGMGVSLSRNAAKCRTFEERQEQLANANGIVLGLSLVVVVAVSSLLGSGYFFRLGALTETPATVLASVLFLAAIPLDALKNNYLALLQGTLDVKGVAIGRSVAVLFATAVAVPVVWFFGFVGAAIQYLLLSAFIAVLLGWRCRSLGYSPLLARLDRRRVSLLASFGLASMASAFAQGLSDTAVRARLIHVAGAAANGLLQAPFALAVTLKEIVLASIGSVALATIAAKTDHREISRALDQLLNVVIPIGAAALGLLGLLGVPALTLLYSKAFSAGAMFFPYVLGADLLLVLVWVIGAPLLARGDRALWLALDLVHAAARWSLATLLMPWLGARGVVVGYLVAVALHAAWNLAVCRRHYRLDIPAKHLRRLLYGMVLVAFLSSTGARPGGSVPATVAAVVAWIAYVVHYARREGFMSVLQRRLQRS